MSSLHSQHYGEAQRSASVGSAEWEMLDEGLSVSSFSSNDDSEATRIIFGESQRKQHQRRFQQQALSASTVVDNKDHSTSTHSSADQRLMDRIAQLAEDLSGSQEQAKLLMMQNQRLSIENQDLKRSFQQLVRSQNNKQNPSHQSGLFDGDLKTTAMAVATGIVMMTMLKKRIMIGSVNVIGGVALAGVTASLWSLWQNLQPDEKEQSDSADNTTGPKPLKLKLQHTL